MGLLDDLRARFVGSKLKLCFCEPDELEILKAAAMCARAQVAEVYLLGKSDLADELERKGFDPTLFTLVDIEDEELGRDLASRYASYPACILKEKGILRRLTRPLERSLMMQAVGDVDLTFAGKTATTGDVIAQAQTILGKEPGIACASSMGIFEIPEGEQLRYLAFGDSAVCVNPTAEVLASIAVSCCDSVRDLLGWEPKCALLSYATLGSAHSDLTEKVLQAKEIATSLRPDLAIDGEFQLDAAIDPEVAARKVKRDSKVAGQANIIVWPDINVGNIGVKLVQQFAHANAYGPLLQGFLGIVCDCSRSAKADEIYGNALMSLTRAKAQKEREL